MRNIILGSIAACALLIAIAPKAAASCDDRFINTCDTRAWHWKADHGQSEFRRGHKRIRTYTRTLSYAHTHARRIARAAQAGAKAGGQASVARGGLVSRDSTATQIVEHPAGCPRTAFCGCGVAQHIFGQIGGAMRELWLAANWFRFPRASPAPGMVAVRRHHVFAIQQVIDGNKVIAYDPNSGGHRTRIHVRSLAGYTVVNPRGGKG